MEGIPHIFAAIEAMDVVYPDLADFIREAVFEAGVFHIRGKMVS